MKIIQIITILILFGLNACKVGKTTQIQPLHEEECAFVDSTSITVKGPNSVLVDFPIFQGKGPIIDESQLVFQKGNDKTVYSLCYEVEQLKLREFVIGFLEFYDSKLLKTGHPTRPHIDGGDIFQCWINDEAACNFRGIGITMIELRNTINGHVLSVVMNVPLLNTPPTVIQSIEGLPFPTAEKPLPSLPLSRGWRSLPKQNLVLVRVYFSVLR